MAICAGPLAPSTVGAERRPAGVAAHSLNAAPWPKKMRIPWPLRAVQPQTGQAFGLAWPLWLRVAPFTYLRFNLQTVLYATKGLTKNVPFLARHRRGSEVTRSQGRQMKSMKASMRACGVHALGVRARPCVRSVLVRGHACARCACVHVRNVVHMYT